MVIPTFWPQKHPKTLSFKDILSCLTSFRQKLENPKRFRRGLVSPLGSNTRMYGGWKATIPIRLCRSGSSEKISKGFEVVRILYPLEKIFLFFFGCSKSSLARNNVSCFCRSLRTPLLDASEVRLATWGPAGHIGGTLALEAFFPVKTCIFQRLPLYLASKRR